MTLQSTDNLAIARAGTNYKITAAEILAYIEANIGTSQFNVADIAARNALANLSYGDRIYVVNATGDATVASGWAIYLYVSTGVFTKVAEQESLDVIAGATNLSYTSGAGSGIVVSDTGADATIPAATGAIAGLLLPAQFNKLGLLTVTAATDLDAIRTASHAAVTTSGSATTNPITVTGQALSFNIAGLASAP